MTMPVVSVVMSVYNGEKYLREAVESILGQTFSNFEFIIIDDGSTDASKTILEKYVAKDSRMRLVSHENRGLTRSLNEGLQLARGRLVARMDADDIALPDRFQHQIEYLRSNPKIAAIGTWVYFVDELGDKMKAYHSPAHPAIIAWELCMGNMLWHPTMMIRREWLEKIGNYDEGFQVAQDFDLWSRIFRAGGQVAVLPEVLLFYRWSPQQISKNKMEAQAVAVMQVMRDHLCWLTGSRVNDAVIASIWDLLGSGRNQNYQASFKALKLMLLALRKSQNMFQDTPARLLHETAFSRLFERAKSLIPDYSNVALQCAFAAICAHPRVLLRRDFFREMARIFLRIFPRINSLRKMRWPHLRGS